jgi:hypothetical protein
MAMGLSDLVLFGDRGGRIMPVNMFSAVDRGTIGDQFRGQGHDVPARQFG